MASRHGHVLRVLNRRRRELYGPDAAERRRLIRERIQRERKEHRQYDREARDYCLTTVAPPRAA